MPSKREREERRGGGRGGERGVKVGRHSQGSPSEVK